MTDGCPCVDGLPDPCTVCGAPADGVCGYELSVTIAKNPRGAWSVYLDGRFVSDHRDRDGAAKAARQHFNPVPLRATKAARQDFDPAPLRRPESHRPIPDAG